MTAPYEPPTTFPHLALPDLDGVERPVEGLWAEGPAVIMLGHRDCGTTRLTLPVAGRMYARRPAGTSVTAVLQDDADSAREVLAEFGLELPVLLEADPYRLAAELGLRTVPTIFLVGTDGAIRRFSEGFRRDELEVIAAELGMAGSLFSAADAAPARRPG